MAGAGVIQSICLPLLSVYEGPSNGATQVQLQHPNLTCFLSQTLYDVKARCVQIRLLDIMFVTLYNNNYCFTLL